MHVHGRLFMNSDEEYFVPLFQNESSCKTFCKNEFDLHENEPVGGAYFRVSTWCRHSRNGPGNETYI